MTKTFPPGWWSRIQLTHHSGWELGISDFGAYLCHRLAFGKKKGAMPSSDMHHYIDPQRHRQTAQARSPAFQPPQPFYPVFSNSFSPSPWPGLRFLLLFFSALIKSSVFKIFLILLPGRNRSIAFRICAEVNSSGVFTMSLFTTS